MLDLPAHRSVVAISGSGHVRVQEEPMPAPTPGRLLVRVHASVISPGTELGAYVGKQRTDAPREPFRTFGYQSAGTIIACGEGCEGFSVGQRVACMGGGYALHADYASVPRNLCVGLPDDVSFDEGAFCALGATALQAVRRGEVAFGEEVAVLGLGLLGQLTAQVAQAAGARVLPLDPLAFRAELARRCGLSQAAAAVRDEAIRLAWRVSEGQGMDCGFLCFGGEATAALQSLVKMMKEAPDTHRWGRIVIPGGATITHRFGADLGNLDLRSAARTGAGYHDEVYEHGGGYPRVFVRWDTTAHLRLFVRWVAEGKLRVKELITDRAPLAQAPEACYALMDDPGGHLGVVIHYD